jgi:hypothetical protein
MQPFFISWTAKDGDRIKLNGALFTLCAIIRFVVASAAEAKLGALFLNCKEGMIFHLTLEELGHPQPKTQVHCNKASAMDNKQCCQKILLASNGTEIFLSV